MGKMFTKGIPAVYIMTNKSRSVLYTGVTSDLSKRIYEHKNDVMKGFTSRYNCKSLAFYKVLPDMMTAIEWEKKIKAGSRRKKLEMIEQLNPGWVDLYAELV